MDEHFDLVVLGAGPGGYVAAVRGSQLGLRTAVVEQKYWGGVCVNVGCIPSKALLRNAEIAHLLARGAAAFGITVTGRIDLDYGEAFRRSRKAAEGRVRGVHFLMKKNGIAEIHGRGSFAGPNTLQVDGADGQARTIGFRHCVIATGASPRLLPGTSLSERIVTYEEQIMRPDLSGSIIIAGAGAIGVEFGYVLHNYGVKVTIVEFLDRILPQEDEEISAELLRRYRRLGIEVLTSTSVTAIEESRDSVQVSVSRGGEQYVLQADVILQAIGFRPNVAGYGLDKASVRLTDQQAIEVDGSGRTSVPSIFAIGDVTAKLMLAHTAEAMGIVAAETIAGVETAELNYAMVPRAVFCQPQVASFGYTEAQARELGFDVRVAKFPFTANGKAQGLGQTAGFAKLICDGGRGEVLGAHLIGPDVSELLPELTLAQQWDLTVYELAHNIHVHPTLGEAVKDAVHGLAGHMINM
jgi:dihydrolipoamide dehydrogenase